MCKLLCSHITVVSYENLRQKKRSIDLILLALFVSCHEALIPTVKVSADSWSYGPHFCVLDGIVYHEDRW